MSLIERKPDKTIRIWFAAIIIIYAIIAIVGVKQGLHQKKIADVKHDERISTDKYESGKTRAVWDAERLATSKPIKVESGIYVERIIDLSITDASWIADFYIWFRWTDKRVNPGKSFQVVNGEILKREKVDTDLKSNPYYALYRVKAKITKFFNPARYPRDDHLLTINIEDKKNQIYRMQYVPDTAGSAVSSRVKLHGYKIYNLRLTQKFHSYKTSRGEIKKAADNQDTFSQLIYGIWIKRPGWGNFVKMFEGLFSAVAVALLSFFIRTTTTNRISLGVGAFFAAVAATYVASRNLPNIGILTLTDVITGVAMMTVFLIIWHTIIATRLYELHKQDVMVQKFDIFGFMIFFACFIGANAALVLAASR